MMDPLQVGTAPRDAAGGQAGAIRRGSAIGVPPPPAVRGSRTRGVFSVMAPTASIRSRAPRRGPHTADDAIAHPALRCFRPGCGVPASHFPSARLPHGRATGTGRTAGTTRGYRASSKFRSGGRRMRQERGRSLEAGKRADERPLWKRGSYDSEDGVSRGRSEHGSRVAPDVLRGCAAVSGNGGLGAQCLRSIFGCSPRSR